MPYLLTAGAVVAMVAGWPWTGAALAGTGFVWGFAEDLREARRRREVRRAAERYQEGTTWIR